MNTIFAQWKRTNDVRATKIASLNAVVTVNVPDKGLKRT